jgi:hypothetical protein
MDQIEHAMRVNVFEQGVSDVAGRLSVSNVPLSWALRMIQKWPQERREGVLIELPDRTVPWIGINDLYDQLYSRTGTVR